MCVRIWSKKLIPVLPNKQLMAMRYELGDMIKQYPNIKNPLVKFANNYDCCYLYDYFSNVILECKYRKINMDEKYHLKIFDMAIHKSNGEYDILEDYTFLEDNADYLKICYWNLYEKAIRGVISDEEWKRIEDLIGKEVK